MQIGMIGLGRMGSNMVLRLIKAGHECVVFDTVPQVVERLVAEKAIGAASLKEFIQKLRAPRAIWLMVPAGAVDNMVKQVAPLLSAGDVMIDGGNSYYVDDIRRAKELAAQNIHYVDVGTSGGTHGLERGYCLMIGGEKAVVSSLASIFATLAPGVGDIERTPGLSGAASTSEHGYLHCGPNGAGHFVKMVHNGIEYGVMAAFAEGFSVLRGADVLKLVMKPESVGLRTRVWESMEVIRGPRITDADLRGYHRPEPGWIADRICCLSIAAELVRIALDRKPAFEPMRQILESQPAAKQLLLECRAGTRATHSSCHFPDGTVSPVSKLDGLGSQN
jgi:6-phosphogluconate dehydrogenase (decarboxylating)